MRLIPFCMEHLDKLEPDLSHNLDGRLLLATVPEELAAQILVESWSLEHGGKIVACGGRSGVEGSGLPFSWWLLCEAEALRCKLSFTRVVRRMLRQHAKPGDLAHALDPFAAEWLEALGFVPAPEPGDQAYARYEWPA